MDPSKLQKMSDEREPPAVGANIPATGNPGIGGEVWINTIIGIILIAAGRNFARFLFAKLTGQPFHTYVTFVEGQDTGAEVPYFDLEGFVAWTDMGMFFFGVVVLLEAMVSVAMSFWPGVLSRGLLAISLVLSVAATALNLYVCVRLFGIGVTPILSGLAVAFGGWIVLNEWRMLRAR